MSILTWDATAEHFYETGVDHGVLYLQQNDGSYGTGVVWNGLTGVTESPEGAEATPLYADNIKYLNLISAEDYGMTIEAYTYPDDFAVCDGSASIATGVKISQQARKAFGFVYRTRKGNDVSGDEYGYKLHLVYGCKASPSERSYETVNDSPEAITFSWEINTTPTPVTGYKPTSHIEVESDAFTSSPAKLAALEAILFGAPEFDAASTYKVGDIVEYTTNTKAETFVCKTAISTAAAWDVTKWDKIGDAGPRLPLPDEIASILS